LNISGFTASFEPEFQTLRQEYARNFLWYGGTGALHKGLDLCIEAFRKLPELNLYIVGEPNSELYDFYRADIEQGENIYYYGYLNKDSEEFREVCETCGFCIAPSCSEGQSTSVLTAMFAGMIPVCTKQNGIDLERCGGVWIEDSDLENLAGLIEKLSKMEAAEINQRRRQAYDYVKNNHTIDHYRANLKRVLEEIFDTVRP
jgi:glycosyltransferase involved in cell wall biosynthesis